MDLAKAQKVLRKNFKDHGVTSKLDEETLLMFICVDLVREDMTQDAPAPARAKKKDDANGQQ